MIQDGIGLSEEQNILVHKNIMLTQSYVHFIKKDAADKAAVILEGINQLSTAYTPT